MTSLVVQWLRLHLLVQEVRVRSAVGELRSYMPPGQKTKTRNRSNTAKAVKTLKMAQAKADQRPPHSEFLSPVIRKLACCTLSDSPPPPRSNKLYSSLKKKKKVRIKNKIYLLRYSQLKKQTFF